MILLVFIILSALFVVSIEKIMKLNTKYYINEFLYNAMNTTERDARNVSENIITGNLMQFKYAVYGCSDKEPDKKQLIGFTCDLTSVVEKVYFGYMDPWVDYIEIFDISKGVKVVCIDFTQLEDTETLGSIADKVLKYF